MKATTIPLIQNISGVPAIKFELWNGITGHALIDTGCEDCIINSRWLEHYKSEFTAHKLKNDMLIVGVTEHEGSVADTEYETTIALWNYLHNEAYVMNIRVVPLDISHLTEAFNTVYDDEPVTIDALFGSTFLKHTNAIIDYNKQEMKVK